MADVRISVAEAGARMGLGRRGALKRLKRLDHHLDGRLLWRPGPRSPWEVCVAALDEIHSVNFRDRSLEALDDRIQQIDKKLFALRNAHGAHRRKTEKRFQNHENALLEVGSTCDAVKRHLGIV